MTIELDHVFILCDPGAPQAALLTEAGLVEGPPNHHPGQGSANRRFFFANTVLELIYLVDMEETDREPARGLRLKNRWLDASASPFGLIVRRDNANAPPPFPGWRYYPEYFEDRKFFIVGENSDLLQEPLCICMPDRMPANAGKPRPRNPTMRLSGLRVCVPAEQISPTLAKVAGCPGVAIEPGQPHLLELYFGDSGEDQEIDFRPDLPLLVRR